MRPCVGTLPNLKAGDVLIFEEVIGPHTRRSEDADPAHRCAVRLTHVADTGRGGSTVDRSVNRQAITEIFWADEDALPFRVVHLGPNRPRSWGQVYRSRERRARQYRAGGSWRHHHRRGIRSGSSGACGADRPVPIASVATPKIRWHCRRVSAPSSEARPLTFATPSVAELLFGFTPNAGDVSDLDNKTLPTDLQKQLEAASIGFSTGASIQGAQPIWSVSDGWHALVVKAEQGKLNVYSLPGAARTATAQEPRSALPAARLHSTLNLDEALLDTGARFARQRRERSPFRRGN